MNHTSAVSLALLLLCRAAAAQSPAGQPYVDASFGYSITPPANWTIDTKRVPDPRGTRLLRATHPVPGGSVVSEIMLEVRTYPNRHAVSLGDVAADTLGQLRRASPDAKSITSASQPIAGMAGQRNAYQLTLAGRNVMRYEAIIPARGGRYFVLTGTGLAEIQDRVRDTFEVVLRSFQFTEDETSLVRTRAATRRTAEWIGRLKKSQILTDRLQPPICLRITTNGRESGYVVIREEPYTFNGREGIRISERGWSTNPSGETSETQNDLFLSADFEHEVWDNRTFTLIPAAGEKPPALGLSVQEGLRSRNVLITGQCFTYGKAVENNPEIRLPAEGYVPRLLVRWLPRLVDLNKPDLYAYTAYDPARNGLVLRSSEIIPNRSAATAPADGPTGDVMVRDREGLSGAPTEIRFDASGRLKRIQAGEVVMEPADQKAVEERWSARVEKADAEMMQLDKQFREGFDRFGTRKPQAPLRAPPPPRRRR